MFKFFIKYVMQHTLFKESDSAKTSEQADNLILTTILSLPCLSEKSAGA